VNPDVQQKVTRGTFLSGYHHYLVNGRRAEHGCEPMREQAGRRAS
jgi:hypothetical protein